MPIRDGGRCRWHVCEGRNGRIGDKGEEVKEPYPSASGGRDGKVAIAVDDGGLGYEKRNARLAKAASKLYLDTVYREASVLYINGEIEEAIDRFRWLLTLLSTSLQCSADRNGDDICTSSTSVSAPSHEHAAVRRLVRTHLLHIAMGRDYWGNSPQFVPLIKHSHLADYAQTLIKYAKEVESAYIEYQRC